MKIDWKRKLTSRKFWLAGVGFVTALLIAFKANAATIESVTGIISAFGVLIAYILGESYVDGKHIEPLEGIELETASNGGGIVEDDGTER